MPRYAEGSVTVENPSGLSSAILHILRGMDAEATTTRRGHPTGLNWYGGHIRPDLDRPQTEPLWSKEIACRLTDYGYDTVSEVPCPGKKWRCDLVVQRPDREKIWIEVKGAWKEWWRQQGGGDLIYRSYLLHPLVPNLDTSKTHTVPFDLERLGTLRPPDATDVGMLLVGFDSCKNPMDADVAELVDLAGLGEWPWIGVHTAWPDAYRPGERVRCWLWLREVLQGEQGQGVE